MLILRQVAGPTPWERFYEALKNGMEDTMIWEDILKCGKVEHTGKQASLRNGYGS